MPRTQPTHAAPAGAASSGTSTPHVNIASVDPELWHRFKVEAMRCHLPLGVAVSAALAHCLDDHDISAIFATIEELSA